MLARLVQHFSHVSLRNDRMAEPDLLTGIPASILVLSRDKPAARRGKVLFIDASGEFEEGSNQNLLREQDIEHVSRTFHACADVESTRGWCRSPKSSRTTGI